MQSNNDYYRNVIFILSVMVVLSLGGLLFVILKESGHARNNTIILCKGITGNEANTANSDQEILDLCKDVGVSK